MLKTVPEKTKNGLCTLVPSKDSDQPWHPLVNSEFFVNSVKRHIYNANFDATKESFTYISKGQSYFAIWGGFYFHETSHMRSFTKRKPS